MNGVDLRFMFPVSRPPFRGARWLLGVIIFLGLFGFFKVCDVFEEGSGEAGDGSYGAALFFCAVIAYIIPIFGYISERTDGALASLEGWLETSPEELVVWRRRVRRKPIPWVLQVFAIGGFSGIAHNVMLNTSFVALWQGIRESTAAFAVVLGTQLTWLVVTLVVAGLIDNAVTLHRAARCSRIDLLDTSGLRPFGTIAVISTLAIVGVQAAFPIMSIESGVDPMAYIPGLVATALPMILIAALPVWPVHRRLSTAKRQTLLELNQQIASLPPPDPTDPDAMARLAPLLAYRYEITQVSEWPFDLGVVTRLCLYLIIPPVTWVGAALIENLVNMFL